MGAGDRDTEKHYSYTPCKSPGGTGQCDGHELAIDFNSMLIINGSREWDGENRELIDSGKLTTQSVGK